MSRRRVSSGGGFAAVSYVLRKGREAGGLPSLLRRLRSRNTCKTCALGMGGQRGGMVNEAGRFPEVCKKSVQAQAGDMAGALAVAELASRPWPELEAMSSSRLEKLGRIPAPLMAGDGDRTFRPVSWEEALEAAARAFRAADPASTFFYASGRSSNEAAFLLQLVARAYGSPHIHNCSSYCHNASSVALGQVYGSGTSSIALDDLEQADLALVAGANPASNHPRMIPLLVRVRKRGGRVIVVNPMREIGLVRFRIPSDPRSLLFGSQVSDLYLQPHVGGDAWLFLAFLKGLLERGALDRAFIDAHTSGWGEAAARASGVSWDTLVERSGVARAPIDEAVGMLAGASRGVCLWAMGLTHHEHGVDNVLALANVALARGWLGKPGCGLMPIRGHSNVQGVGSMGVAPRLRAAFAQRMEELYGIAPRSDGMDTYGSMVAASEGRIRAALLLGGNLFASNPDRAWAAEALRKIPFTVFLSTKLNEGHIHGRGRTTLILPVLARDEEEQATTQESMFNFVRLSEGGTPAVRGSMRSEVAILADLAERLLPAGRFDWAALRSHHQLRQTIASTVPGYAPLAAIENPRGEFHIEGRLLHTPRFPTPDGRARFHAVEGAAFHAPEGAFRLMTLRSEGQFNTVVYEEEDLYRGNEGRQVVMMAEEDARRLGFLHGDRVVVETETGRMEVSVSLAPIRPGNLAMYYPEANALVPRRLDRRSGTPAFKSIVARVRRADPPSAAGALPRTGP